MTKIIILKMKKYFAFIVFFTIFFTFSQKLPNISLSDIQGKKVDIASIDTSEKPVIFSFWATWCLPCIEELNTINEKYDTWQEQYKFTLYAVSTDDARSTSKVKTFVKSKDWKYEVLLDPNQALKRALNINNVPYSLIVYKGEIIYSHVGFSLGDEDEIFTKIKECNESKPEESK